MAPTQKPVHKPRTPIPAPEPAVEARAGMRAKPIRAAEPVAKPATAPAQQAVGRAAAALETAATEELRLAAVQRLRESLTHAFQADISRFSGMGRRQAEREFEKFLGTGVADLDKIPSGKYHDAVARYVNLERSASASRGVSAIASERIARAAESAERAAAESIARDFSAPRAVAGEAAPVAREVERAAEGVVRDFSAPRAVAGEAAPVARRAEVVAVREVELASKLEALRVTQSPSRFRAFLASARTAAAGQARAAGSKVATGARAVSRFVISDAEKTAADFTRAREAVSSGRDRVAAAVERAGAMFAARSQAREAARAVSGEAAVSAGRRALELAERVARKPIGGKAARGIAIGVAAAVALLAICFSESDKFAEDSRSAGTVLFTPTGVRRPAFVETVRESSPDERQLISSVDSLLADVVGTQAILENVRRILEAKNDKVNKAEHDALDAERARLAGDAEELHGWLVRHLEPGMQLNTEILEGLRAEAKKLREDAEKLKQKALGLEEKPPKIAPAPAPAVAPAALLTPKQQGIYREALRRGLIALAKADEILESRRATVGNAPVDALKRQVNDTRRKISGVIVRLGTGNASELVTEIGGLVGVPSDAGIPSNVPHFGEPQGKLIRGGETGRRVFEARTLKKGDKSEGEGSSTPLNGLKVKVTDAEASKQAEEKAKADVEAKVGDAAKPALGETQGNVTLNVHGAQFFQIGRDVDTFPSRYNALSAAIRTKSAAISIATGVPLLDYVSKLQDAIDEINPATAVTVTLQTCVECERLLGLLGQLKDLMGTASIASSRKLPKRNEDGSNVEISSGINELISFRDNPIEFVRAVSWEAFALLNKAKFTVLDPTKY
ncbi:hypothetical protein HY992_06330 [Candidatus Micrarchaeota archaeon]|nr:hypothetical protein [Candidatus Micrarchaeota archaeon]